MRSLLAGGVICERRPGIDDGVAGSRRQPDPAVVDEIVHSPCAERHVAGKPRETFTATPQLPRDTAVIAYRPQRAAHEPDVTHRWRLSLSSCYRCRRASYRCVPSMARA